MKKIIILLVISMVLLLFVGCTNDYDATINVYNWGEYIDPDVIEMFQDEFNIKVNYQTFTTNEDMYVKVSSGSGDYDVLFPSDYMIERLIEEDKLAKLDFTNIENNQYINDMFTDSLYDPKSEFSVPYMWGTVGLLYNKTMVDDVVDSWDILWNEKYSQSILMQDSQRDSIMVALIRLGYSINTTNDSEINEAKQMLIEQRPLVLGYVVDEVQDKMINEEAAVAVVWSGEALLAKDENSDLEYVIPKEGSNVWVDAMVIPKSSDNKYEAELFINFMTREDIALLNADYIGYSTPQIQAFELLDEELKNEVDAYPTDEMLANCEYFVYDEEGTKKYNLAWTEIMAQ